MIAQWSHISQSNYPYEIKSSFLQLNFLSTRGEDELINLREEHPKQWDKVRCEWIIDFHNKIIIITCALLNEKKEFNGITERWEAKKYLHELLQMLLSDFKTALTDAQLNNPV